MAWRIHDNVVRGEIDNRQRGRVQGRIWLHGRAEPIALDLSGNACPDLAGCLLTFQNPGQTQPIPDGEAFIAVQTGSVGDITASRKCRVYDIPVAEAYLMCKRGEKPPEHLANVVYIEWFSQANGRVVIESADYRMQISVPEWRATAEDEQLRVDEAGKGWSNFLGKLNKAVEQMREKRPADEKEWDEFDCEQLLRESDAVGEKYKELLEKYGDDEAAEAIIDREMGWDKPPAGAGLDAEEMEEIFSEAGGEPRPPDPATEGVDWIRVQPKNGPEDIRHPLQHRAHESAYALWAQCQKRGLIDSNADVAELVMEFHIASAKMAGVLNDLAFNADIRDGAFIVASLKRSLGHLHKSQAALEKVAPQNVLPAPVLETARAELFQIREGLLALMQRFRDEK